MLFLFLVYREIGHGPAPEHFPERRAQLV